MEFLRSYKSRAGTGAQPLKNLDLLGVGAIPPWLPCHASSKRFIIWFPRSVSDFFYASKEQFLYCLQKVGDLGFYRFLCFVLSFI